VTRSAGALTLAAQPSTQSAWREHLLTQLDPDWRPDEWNADLQLFTGDADNPFTGVYRCPVDGCGELAKDLNGACQACRGAARRAAVLIADYRLPAFSRPPSTPTPVGRSRLGADRFSLHGLHPTAATELLFALQQRDRDRVLLSPITIRRIIDKLPDGLESLLQLDESFIAFLPTQLVGQTRGLQRHLRRAKVAHDGSDPTSGDVWDSALIGLRSGPGLGREYAAAFGSIGFRPIRQLWLRELFKQYARSTQSSADEIRRSVISATIASRVLAQRPHGDQPTRLAMADMTAIATAFSASTGPNGLPHSYTHRNLLFGVWRRALEFCRQAGLMDDIPGSFCTSSTYHRMVRLAPVEDVISRTIPEHVIRQLDAHLHLLVEHSTYSNGGWSAADFGQMYCLAYVLLRDTGRRPNEIVSLHRDCVEWVDGKPTLVWDNHKRARHGRRLPIHTDTAAAIARWQQALAALPELEGCQPWLFPAPGARNRPRRGHWSASGLCSKIFPIWVGSIPQLHDTGLDQRGQPMPYDRSRITPYAFRHAYAQRHADNGTPVDVLRELMDHRSVETTMIYYQVPLKRKREAINHVAEWTIDRHGNPRGGTDSSDYQRESVSVPFGGCTEPSNVKAGGQHCPIRFQCAGCGFYRPDPSYLPAIEEHIASLRADKETALASDAAGWVLDNLDQQVTAFIGVAAVLRGNLDKLPAEQRQAVEDAAQDLRKDRLAAVFVPLAALTTRTKETA